MGLTTEAGGKGDNSAGPASAFAKILSKILLVVQNFNIALKKAVLAISFS